MDKGVTLIGEAAEMLKEVGVKEVLFLSYPIGSAFADKGDPDQKYYVHSVGTDDFGNIVYWTKTMGKWEVWSTDEMVPWEPIAEPELEEEYEKQIEEILKGDEPDGIPI
jgi:hypothetical protein